MNLSVTTGDIYPASKEQGWGDLPIEFVIEPYCGFTNIGNCGLTVITNVSSSFKMTKRLDIRRVPKPYSTDWGTVSDAGWDVALRKFMDDFYASQATAIFEAIKERIFREAKYQCYLLSDAVNRHSKARSAAPVSPHYPNTAWFARQLVARKVGYIVQSPISVNGVHNAPGDFSLIRTWIWYPPDALAFKPDRYLGYGTILKKSQLVEKIKAQRNFQTDRLSKTIAEEYVDSYKV